MTDNNVDNVDNVDDDQDAAWKLEREKWYAESSDPAAEFAREFAKRSGEPFVWANHLTDEELREEMARLAS